MLTIIDGPLNKTPQKVLPSVMDHKYKDFLKGIYVTENIRNISNIVDCTDFRNMPDISLLND